MNKMFIHYSGTIAAFKAAGHETTYNNSIVFIAGSESDGLAIYTHGKYYGNLTEALAAISTNTTAISNLQTAVAEKAAQSDLNSVSDRVAALESAMGEDGSVTSQISAAIGALDVEKSTGDYIATVEQVDGKIAYTTGTFNFDTAGTAAQALADAKVYANGVAATAKSGAEATADAALAEHASNANLHVTSELQEKWNNAAEDIAAFLNENAVSDEVVNTLKEIQEYIESDGAAADLMTQNIAKAQAAADKAQGEVDALEEVVAGVKTTADAAATNVDLQKETDRAKAAEEANASAISTLSATVESNKTAAETGISEAKAAAEANANAIAALDLNAVNGYVNHIEQTDGKVAATAVATIPATDITVEDSADNFTAATVEAALAELAAMWEWKEL